MTELRQDGVLNRLLRIREVAEILDVSKTKAYHMVASGQLPCLRMGSSVRVPHDELMKWIAENTIRGGAS